MAVLREASLPGALADSSHGVVHTIAGESAQRLRRHSAGALRVLREHDYPLVRVRREKPAESQADLQENARSHASVAGRL